MTFESRARDRRSPRSTAGAVIAGALIAIFGLTLLANNLGFGDLRNTLRHFWPFALVTLGVATLFQQRQQFWGLVMIVGGLWAYAAQRNWIEASFWAVFGPTLLVLLGGAVVWRAFMHPQPESESNAFIHTFAVMSGTEHKPSAIPFQGADLSAVMGSVKLDLTGAQLEGDTAIIDVFTIMGGIEIFVPRDWDVTLKVVSVMGASVDKRRPATLPVSKTVVVRGFAFMGGIEIKD